MRCEFGGETFRIKFTHVDNRKKKLVHAETGKVVGYGLTTRAERRRLGGDGWTLCEIVRVEKRPVETREVEGKLTMSSPYEEWTIVAHKARWHSKVDTYNRAHGRWYALEGALAQLTDSRFARALRKAYYDHVSWRPDGRDGFKIQVRENRRGGVRLGGERKELVRCHRGA